MRPSRWRSNILLTTLLHCPTDTSSSTPNCHLRRLNRPFMKYMYYTKWPLNTRLSKRCSTTVPIATNTMELPSRITVTIPTIPVRFSSNMPRKWILRVRLCWKNQNPSNLKKSLSLKPRRNSVFPLVLRRSLDLSPWKPLKLTLPRFNPKSKFVERDQNRKRRFMKILCFYVLLCLLRWKENSVLW